jgi:hypothetical protein
MPGPHWLTRWVRVNSKHVAFVTDGTIEEDDSGKMEKSHKTESTSESTASSVDQYEEEASSSYTKGNRKHRRSFLKKAFAVSRLEKNSPGHSAVAEVPPLGSVPEVKEEVSQQHKRHGSQPTTEGSDTDTLTAIALAGLSFLPHPFFNLEHEQQHEHREQILELENKLLAALDDLEYMRDLALHVEVAPRADPKQEITTHSEPSLAAVSKQLHDVTAQHKNQVEEMTRERVSRLLIYVQMANSTSLAHFVFNQPFYYSSAAMATRNVLEAE